MEGGSFTVQIFEILYNDILLFTPNRLNLDILYLIYDDSMFLRSYAYSDKPLMKYEHG